MIIQKIKKKRVAHRAALPSRMLEESVDQAPEEIEREKQRGLARFGQEFDKGDEIAIIALQGVTIELQRRLLEKLRDAAYDDEVQDFMHLVDVTDVQRDRTVGALYELKQRLLQAKPIVEVGQSRRQSRLAQSNIPERHDSMDSTGSPESPRQESRARRLTEVAAPSEAQERQPSASRRLKKRDTILGILKTRRTNSSSKIAEPDVESTSQNNPSKQVADPSPPETLPTPKYKYQEWEDDPQQIWGRSSPSNEPASSDPVAAKPTSLTSNRAFGKSSGVSLPTPDNNYLGFCKGAWKLQNGDRKAMQKCREFNDGWSQSSVYYLMCTSKCAFASHMDVDKVWDKVCRECECRAGAAVLT
nr:hypothetical protein CFP56_69575 [Quercus suber]